MVEQLDKRWSRDSYDILNVYPANNLHAVYAQQNNSGRYLYTTEPVLFIALVAVTTTRYVLRSGADRTSIEEVEEPYRSVLGLTLTDGEFSVCDVADNFLGLTHNPSDLSEVYIPSRYLNDD